MHIVSFGAPKIPFRQVLSRLSGISSRLYLAGESYDSLAVKDAQRHMETMERQILDLETEVATLKQRLSDYEDIHYALVLKKGK